MTEKTPSVDTQKGDVQKKADEEQKQGFVGTKVDPIPDSAYSLESGPDSPPIVEDDRTGIAQVHVRDAKAAKEKS